MIRKLFGLIYVLALMGYVLMGVPLTPFHGDESTLIYTTRDYFAQFVARDMADITNTAPTVDPMNVNLRLLDGRIQKYLGGFAYHLTGGTADGLNQPWEWGGDYAYNQQNGNLPSDDLLRVNRWAMAILLALCIPAAFGIGMQIGDWPSALIFPLLIAVSPNILLNGRRAMMEAPLMLFSLLTVLSALRWAGAGRYRWRKVSASVQVEVWRSDKNRWPWLLLLTLSAGLALSSKHSGVLVLVPVFAALGVLSLWRRNWGGLLGLILAGIGVLGVFYLLNPAWWPDPIETARTVLRLRSELLAGQTATFGGYPNLGEQLGGFWRQSFVGASQYYEVSTWAVFIPDQISAYEASPWDGVVLGDIGGVILAIFAVLGIVGLFLRRNSMAWVFGVYAVGVIAAALLLTPLEWARYYLIGLPAIYGLAAVGVSTVILLKSRPSVIP